MSETTSAHISLQKEIDALGFSWFQFVTLALTGGIMFSEGSEMLIMGSVTTLLHDHWDLTPFIRGLMVSIVFVGFFAGNLISGCIGDRFGRRPAILVSYLMIGLCGLLTAAAWSPAVMVTFRFFVGVGCGIGFPAVYSMMPEMCPTHVRGMLSSVMIGFMPLGELFAASILLFVDPHLNRTQGHCEMGFQILGADRRCSWRTLCAYSALPSLVFFVFSYFFLSESPHFLATRGKIEDMDLVVERMKRMNGRAEKRGEPDPENVPLLKDDDIGIHKRWSINMHESRYVCAEMLSERYFSTSMFLFFAHLTKDFGVFGLTYVFPQYFLALRQFSAGIQLTIVASLALPGVVLATILTRFEYFGHIPCIRVLAGATAVFTAGMLEFAPDSIGAPCAYIVKLLAMAFFIQIVVYTAEVFPTVFRNSAVGICVGIGRCGSISAPLLFELSYYHSKVQSLDYCFFLCPVPGHIPRHQRASACKPGQGAS
eukprot:GEMP01040114.1.p1 GENE.GEMP01040114.1~~GEMP01040114.1.p1  ORF type:complete len:483 (+),score=89.31 GEMP01040114.1:335-1783(+)